MKSLFFSKRSVVEIFSTISLPLISSGNSNVFENGESLKNIFNIFRITKF